MLPPFVGQGSRGGSFPAQRIMGISWKGGWRHSQAPPPPWTLSAWRHPPSGKLKNAPRVSCRPVLGGGGDSPPPNQLLPPPTFLLTLFVITLSPPTPRLLPPRVLQLPPKKVKSCRKPWPPWTFTSTPPPPWTLPVWRHPYSSVTLYIVTLCGYITSSTVLWCEGRKEPRHGSLRIICFNPNWKHWIYLGLPTNPHNMVIFPVDLGFPYNLLNIPTNPHNMVIFPVGFPYNLQRAKFPYCRGIPLRVATLIGTSHVVSKASTSSPSGAVHNRNTRHASRIADISNSINDIYNSFSDTGISNSRNCRYH